MPIQLISYLQDTGFDLYNMREWLSGGAPPCQGGGRGFDPRLALEKRTIPNWYRSFFRAQSWARKFDVSAPLRSAQAEVPRTSWTLCARTMCSVRYRSQVQYVEANKNKLPHLWKLQTVDKVSHYCAGFFFAKYQNVQCLCGFFGTFLV